ncbi:NADH-quinone oxidoreductase subunit J [Aeromonas veronii]|uniref:NADH-quinone oxidoreductase subunit J n=1 Tax=Aeromonas TaxID=642 RepID=UPI0018F15EE6|nr:NADH-quinone oxidoreductase subunit J [Aeromonas veronii]MBJ7580069.1 NADH-quinone oxidoreductase subunit J [Aeromonas veronii]MEB5668212.1 NADH-quinone oxidoreductase subunit J [Aeromonas veronii]HDX8427241.1 NADH-quinone oxidoreductase subunit J [Aeromonas veronii]
MELAFYASALVAIYSTLRVISTSNPMHALLNLIISLIAVAMIFFCLGAAFAGALQVIVYAGAIMVLFVFVVMMLNLGSAQAQEKKWLTPMTWGGPALLSLILLGFLAHGILGVTGGLIGVAEVTAKQVGVELFGPYVLAVELASILLLAGLVTAYHLGREEKSGEVLSVPRSASRSAQEGGQQ